LEAQQALWFKMAVFVDERLDEAALTHQHAYAKVAFDEAFSSNQKQSFAELYDGLVVPLVGSSPTVADTWDAFNQCADHILSQPVVDTDPWWELKRRVATQIVNWIKEYFAQLLPTAPPKAAQSSLAPALSSLPRAPLSPSLGPARRPLGTAVAASSTRPASSTPRRPTPTRMTTT
jgi:hypothetical protein